MSFRLAQFGRLSGISNASTPFPLFVSLPPKRLHGCGTVSDLIRQDGRKSLISDSYGLVISLDIPYHVACRVGGSLEPSECSVLIKLRRVKNPRLSGLLFTSEV